MRFGLAFLAAVLAGTALWMYSVAWRHGESVVDVARASGSPETEIEAALPSGPRDPGTESAPAPRARSASASLAAAASGASTPQVFYQYVDARGSVRLTQSLEEIPPEWRARAGKIEIEPRPAPARSQRSSFNQVATAARQAVADLDGQVWGGTRSQEVIIYTTTWCGYCRKAIAHLDERGVDYTNLDVEDDAEAEEEYLRKSGGRRGVPLIDVGGEIMQGYSRGRLDRLLDRLG